MDEAAHAQTGIIIMDEMMRHGLVTPEMNEAYVLTIQARDACFAELGMENPYAEAVH